MSGYPGAAPNMADVKALMAVTHTEFTEGKEAAFRMPPGNDPLRYTHCALGAVGVLKMVEQEVLGFKPHVTFAALMASAAQHPAYVSAATTADMQDEVHVVPLHDEVTKLMASRYAVLLCTTGQVVPL